MPVTHDQKSEVKIVGSWLTDTFAFVLRAMFRIKGISIVQSFFFSTNLPIIALKSFTNKSIVFMDFLFDIMVHGLLPGHRYLPQR